MLDAGLETVQDEPNFKCKRILCSDKTHPEDAPQICSQWPACISCATGRAGFSPVSLTTSFDSFVRLADHEVIRPTWHTSSQPAALSRHSILSLCLAAALAPQSRACDWSRRTGRLAAYRWPFQSGAGSALAAEKGVGTCSALAAWLLLSRA